MNPASNMNHVAEANYVSFRNEKMVHGARAPLKIKEMAHWAPRSVGHSNRFFRHHLAAGSID